ncbi:methyltransferase family protein [Morganella psychrotolerans]|uniref:methyltransferase family protein n=1 Tax=Morganella psychrotolerans TaxID=368603 RepID=UPI0039AFB85B
MAIFRLPFLNWLILNGLAAGWLYLKGGLIFQFSGWTGILALLTGLESLGWIGAALVYFRRHNTTVNPLGEATSLITGGPFRLSRNPVYLALTTACIGFALLTHSFYFLVAGLIFWLITDLFSIPQEEQFLAGRFKKQWTQYCQQTRRWL